MLVLSYLSLCNHGPSYEQQEGPRTALTKSFMVGLRGAHFTDGETEVHRG